jgi:hypothetical protein
MFIKSAPAVAAETRAQQPRGRGPGVQPRQLLSPRGIRTSDPEVLSHLATRQRHEGTCLIYVRWLSSGGVV